MIRKMILIAAVALTLSSCTVVKGYQKARLNDPDMELSDMTIDKNITTVHAYREAASGGNGGKTGGGCGCN